MEYKKPNIARDVIQPITPAKIKTLIDTAAPIPNISPTAKLNAINPPMLQRLLKQERVLGLGETFWRPVLEGDERFPQMFARTMSLGKTLDRRSAGARGNKLVADIASGISSCHEPVTADEVMERAAELGTTQPNVHISLSALTTGAIPFFRICETGLMDIRKGEIVDLMVS